MRDILENNLGKQTIGNFGMRGKPIQSPKIHKN